MKVLWWIPRMFAAVGFALLLWASWFYQREQEFVRHATRTQGTIVDLNYKRDDDGGAYYPIFRFQDTRGQVYSVSSRVGRKPPSRHLGDVVDVLYDPADPDHARIDGWFQLHSGSFIITMLALVFGGTGSVWVWLQWRTARLIDELRHSGVRIQAKVIGVEQRRNITVNNRHPWRITAEAQEASRAGQIFRSGNIWRDPTPYMKETVDVFVDRDNPAKHYVDLGFLPPES